MCLLRAIKHTEACTERQTFRPNEKATDQYAQAQPVKRLEATRTDTVTDLAVSMALVGRHPEQLSRLACGEGDIVNESEQVEEPQCTKPWQCTKPEQFTKQR